METIYTKSAPEPVGPYSQAVWVGGFLFCSGQVPIDPNTNEVLKGSIQEQTELVFSNIRAVLSEAGLSLKDVFKTSVFLSDMSLFAEMNAVYAENFSKPFPARSCVAVKELPKSVDVEIEVIARKGN